MSIATEIAALAANKAAIKAAITAKNPATAPTDALSQWPTSIASIPTGSSLDEIIAATSAMDGLSHTGATASQLASAITEITRRRTTPLAPASSWHPDAGKSAFVVRVVNDGAHGLQFTLGGADLIGGRSSYTIEWGDGTSSTVSQTGNVRTTHTYASAGEYMVQISDDVQDWYPHFAEPNGTNYFANQCNRPQAAWSHVVSDGHTDGYWDVLNKYKIVRALQWGASIRRSKLAYNCAVSLSGTVPEWPTGMDDCSYCYKYAQGLTGAAPDWPNSMYNAMSCFAYSGITGRIPSWNGVKYVSSCYEGCTGLTGGIPSWGSEITDTTSTYAGCTGIVGPIPEWTNKITAAVYTYRGCYNLSGPIPAWGSAITSAARTYESCWGLTGGIPAWTDAIINADSTFSMCVGLSGVVPKWGSAITNANACYQYCIGLTGPWSSSATDAELMPSHITNHINTFANCEDRLRAYFLTTWGGTRAS